MENLIFFSNQVQDEKDEVNNYFKEFFQDEGRKIGYIPSKTDKEYKHYKEKLKYYSKYNISSLYYFDLDENYNEKKLNDLLKCDAIHLSGGDTNYFLYSMYKRNFIPVLRKYVERGGLLIGISAGAIIMTEHINIIKLDCKESIKYSQSLGFVDFEFYPHFTGKEDEIDMLKKYSLKSKSKIYACKDGDVIIVNGVQIKFVGDILTIENGKAYF